MFRAAYRSSSEALNRPLSSLSEKCKQFPFRLDNGRSPHAYVNQRLQIKFRAPDDEWYDARNMLSF
jgi:hypothetical protein